MRATATTALALILLAPAALALGAPEGDLGTEEHPVLWALVPLGDDAAAAAEIAERIYELTGIRIQAVVTDSYGAILEALSATPAGAHMTVLPAIPYLAAQERRLVEPGLVAVRAESTSYAAKVMVNSETGAEELTGLSGLSFARPGPQSDSGWIVPALLMRAEGLDPEELGTLLDLGAHPAVVEAVYNREADAGAVHVGGLAAFRDQYEDLDERIAVLAESAQIPNEGLQFAPRVPQEMRTLITNAFLQLVESPDGAELLRRIYSWDALEQASDRAYDDLRGLLDRAELTSEQLLNQDNPNR